MCRPSDLPPPALSRRGLFASAVLPASGFCRGEAGGSAPVEPRMRLALAADAPPSVALTLDGCSGAADLRILAALVRLGVPATLFVTARFLRRNRELVPQLRARENLFSLQNHGERHVPAVLGTFRPYGLAPAGTLAAVQREVAGGAAAIVATGAPPPRWYRGATALYSPAALPAIEAMGFRIAGFSLNADEGASVPAASVARRIAAARPGDVIIAHANHPEQPSGAGVVAGVEALLAKGVRFTGLDVGPVTPLRCQTAG
jgi:peptidoglycan/xylan/chitin deacetylase (PgdA/CDA1 family)